MKASALSLSDLKSWLPERPADAHKGRFGHVLIVAGSRGMVGAAVLAARGAMRAGAGLVTLALPESQLPVAAAHIVEAMTLPLPETSSGALRSDAVAKIIDAHDRRGYTAMALGPGIGTRSESQKAVVGVLGNLKIPVVIDADGLNVLSMVSRKESRRLLERRGAPFIITPHPGELGRLLRSRAVEIESDRADAVTRAFETFGGVCLLKGRKTMIGDGRRLRTNISGNAGLAKGGSGDALTGIIAGIWAQRLAANAHDSGFEAACIGAYLHGFAADRAAKEKTARALLASDVIEALPAAFKKLGG
jgi:NAD(P)H-hydrate epimerase